MARYKNITEMLKSMDKLSSRALQFDEIVKRYNLQVIGYEVKSSRRLKIRAYVLVDGDSTIYPVDL
jgi:hypothetical protein